MLKVLLNTMVLTPYSIVRVPQVTYETLWDTTQFNNLPWPTDGSQPFVLSYGDNKGYGSHADYMFGWKGDALQRAMDSSCMFNACENGNPLKSQQPAQMNACTIKPTATDNIDGCELITILFILKACTDLF